MDTRNLRVTTHAAVRFGQRVEGLPWDDDVQLVKSERDRIQGKILKRISGGRTLPTHCCLLFVKPGRGAKDRNVQDALADGTLSTSSGETAWGSYVYDGTVCYVIEDNEVVTIVAPDEEQHRGLEDLLDRLSNAPDAGPPPSIPLDMCGQREQLLRKAVEVNELLHAASDHKMPEPVSVEIYYPHDIIEDELHQKPAFVAGFLRWIGRVIPARDKPVMLILDPHFRFFTSVTDLLSVGRLETTIMPRGFDQHTLAAMGDKAPGYTFVRNALNGQLDDYAHTFFLCTRKTVSAVLGVARRHTASFDPLSHVEYFRGTVFALDRSKPPRERLSRFYV